MRREKLPPEEVITGGCPDGFWAAPNCRYVQTLGWCRTPAADRPRDAAAGPGGADPKETRE